MSTHHDVVKALMAMASIYDKALNDGAAEMLMEDLSEFEPTKILSALKLCRLELNRFPTTAEIIKRMSVKSEAGQTQEIVGNIFKAISWHGYTNPNAAREMIGEVGWRAVEFFGGWQRICDTPSEDVSVMRGQIRKSVEAAVEEKTRCDALNIPFNANYVPNILHMPDKKPEFQTLDYSNFLPDGDGAA